MNVVRDRLDLLRGVRAAGPWAVGALATAFIAEATLPALAAVAVGLLVGRLDAGGSTGVWIALGLFAAVLFLRHVVDALLEPLIGLVVARVNGAQRVEVAVRASGAPSLADLEDPAVADLVRTASADPENWTERTPGDGAVAVMWLAGRAVGAVSACAVVAAHAWWLVPLLVIPALTVRSLSRRRDVLFARLWASGIRVGRRADYWRGVVLSAPGGKEQRVYGFGEWAVDRAVGAVRTMFDPLWSRAAAFHRTSALFWIALILPLAVVQAIVAAAVVRGEATLGLQAAVLAAGIAVYGAVGPSWEAQDIEGGVPVMRALHRLRDRLSAGDGPASDGSRPATRRDAPPPRVECAGVSFAYPGSDRPVLRDLDLVIHPGELLAVVGRNGAGKSTLIKILSGLYRPDGGRVTADGTDLTRLGPAWRDRIAVVFQDFVRYHLSVADNVTLGRGGAPVDRQALEAAAEESGLREIVERLPQGWETPLSRDRTGGVDLSGGQWQHVALARALYAVRLGAGLLVLDEPTAHLDVRSELELFSRLTGRADRLSVVLISHRLSTVRLADRIVLLDSGRIVESGSHAELMAVGGEYAEMFTLQAERFAQGYDDRVEAGAPDADPVGAGEPR